MSRQTDERVTDHSVGEAHLAPSAWTHIRSRAFVILGTIAVVGGGLMSAAIAPHPSYHGSWAVAYIVLVLGVAQLALGVAQTAVTGGTTRSGTITAQVIAFNVGGVATLVGTLMGAAPVLWVGAVLQVIALVLFLVATAHGRRGATVIVARIITILLLVSTPVGIVLQAVTH